ncbi:hypothetical protein YC2023_008467 [Brassica napus]
MLPSIYYGGSANGSPEKLLEDEFVVNKMKSNENNLKLSFMNVMDTSPSNWSSSGTKAMDTLIESAVTQMTAHLFKNLTYMCNRPVEMNFPFVFNAKRAL